VIAVLGMAASNLRVGGSRAWLALIGVMIGAAAVVSMINIGQNAGIEAKRQFEASGINVISAFMIPDEPARPDGFSQTSFDALRAVPAVEEVTSISTSSMLGEIAILGVEANFTDVSGADLDSGRFVSPWDMAEMFAVLGANVTWHGTDVSIADRDFRIIGKLRSVVSNPLLPANINTSILIPIGAMPRVMPGFAVRNLLIRLKPGSDQTLVAATVTAALSGTVTRGSVIVNSAEQLIAAMREQSALHARILLAMAVISLVVGGIGIMNMMLTSVLERRQEIGVRKAIGAPEFDIAAMFLAESMILCSVGGSIGTLLGLGASYIYAHSAGWAFYLSASAASAGVLLAALSGALFGYYPARRAAKLSPVEALRSE